MRQSDAWKANVASAGNTGPWPRFAAHARRAGRRGHVPLVIASGGLALAATIADKCQPVRWRRV
ncbi:hypothetical protein [Lysobacter gummosus]|uniref:hypothetical protein n=1 Tax=Lysobacter gummosus TaxID=262324 RepID=UPI003636554E